MPLAGRVALVTGASSGIGLATVRLLAQRGAQVVGCARNEQKLKQAIAKCNEEVKHARPDAAAIKTIVCDVTDEDSTRELVKHVIDQYGRLQILVNNAGALETGSILETSLEQYDRLMNVNLRSVYHLSMLCAPHLIETKGNIVNVSSVNGIRSFAGVLAYNVSKAGVDQLTRCTALELADKGVRVNAVNPGVTVTSLHLSGGMSPTAYEQFLDRAKSTHALGRPATADEVALAVGYLCGDQAGFVTGVTLPVDGGRHAMCPR